MHARHPLATLCVSILSLLGLAGIAQAAAPVTVNVRIEGNTETLFEGPISVTPHNVQASSDTVERRCDGINKLDPWNTVPNPTAISASVDAMSLLGETFDGQWYPGYDDYLVKRFGPDAEKEGKSWGVEVNNTFLDVGGCQYQLDSGDEVLWVFNAFKVRPFLALFPAGYPAGSRPLTATASLGQPFEVEVVSYEDGAEDAPPAHPERTGSMAFEGADVSPVSTNSKGFEKVETGSSETVITGTDGKAQIAFTTPGWHRIKATVPGPTEEEAFRSNRLDVCVPALGETECGALPPEDEMRVPQTTIEAPAREQREREEREAEEQVEREAREAAEREELAKREEAADAADKAAQTSSTQESSGPPSTAAASPPATTPPGTLRVSVPKVDPKRLKRGKVALRWKVLEAGPGVRSWTISSRSLGAKKASYVRRASGTTATSASLRLPRGAYRLRFTLTDALGRTSTVTIGKVVVPGAGRG